MADERAERCERCRHWEPYGEDHDPGEPDAGLCRRYPPPCADALGDMLWPETRAADWCGEFAPRLDPPPPAARGGRRRSALPLPRAESCDLSEAFDYGLPLQVQNALESRGILRLDQLLTWDAEGLLALPRFGPWALAKVREVLAGRGLALRGDPPPVDTAPPDKAQ